MWSDEQLDDRFNSLGGFLVVIATVIATDT